MDPGGARRRWRRPGPGQLADHLYDYSLTVEPAQVWALLPAYEGARAVDLTTEEIRGPVDVGCPGQDVRAMFPAVDGAPDRRVQQPADADADAVVPGTRCAMMARC